MKQLPIVKPKISVIIPVYNQEKYIGRCLRSILSQTIDKNLYEIIVINDGSTDLTSFAIDQFLSPDNNSIKVFNNHKNMGLPSSVNKGILKSLGDYIVRVDSDDYVNSRFLDFLYTYSISNNSDAVACDYMHVDKNENVISRENCFKNPIACGILFKKKALISIGLYDEDFACYEEQELRIRFE